MFIIFFFTVKGLCVKALGLDRTQLHDALRTVVYVILLKSVKELLG